MKLISTAERAGPRLDCSFDVSERASGSRRTDSR